FIKTFVVILPPALAMGAAFPLIGKIVARGPAVVGRAIGTAYSANTLGAIAGSVVSGFVAIPLLGMRGSLAVTSLLSVGIGAVLLASGSVSRVRQGLTYAGVLSLFAVVMLATPSLHFADI